MRRNQSSITLDFRIFSQGEKYIRFLVYSAAFIEEGYSDCTLNTEPNKEH